VSEREELRAEQMRAKTALNTLFHRIVDRLAKATVAIKAGTRILTTAQESQLTDALSDIVEYIGGGQKVDADSAYAINWYAQKVQELIAITKSPLNVHNTPQYLEAFRLGCIACFEALQYLRLFVKPPEMRLLEVFVTKGLGLNFTSLDSDYVIKGEKPPEIEKKKEAPALPQFGDSS